MALQEISWKNREIQINGGATNWPPTELIANDIENGNSYVCLNNNKIIATFFFVQGKKILNQHMLKSLTVHGLMMHSMELYTE